MAAGCSPSTERYVAGKRVWTLAEDFRLMDMVNSHRPQTIARRLGRTEKAVRRRMERLRLAPTTNGVLTGGEAARITGLSPQYLSHLARQRRIRARRVPGGRWWCYDPLAVHELAMRHKRTNPIA